MLEGKHIVLRADPFFDCPVVSFDLRDVIVAGCDVEDRVEVARLPHMDSNWLSAMMM